MRWNANRALTLAWLLTPSGVAACSLIDTYDPLVPALAPDASPGPDVVDETPAPPPNDATGGGDVAPDNAVQPIPSPGAIVIGGTASSDAGDQLVLTALDPRTGSEFPRARVPMNVSAVEYDGARDLWYVFESGGSGIYPLPTDTFILHVRELDRVSGQWTERAVVSIPPGVSFLTTAVLGNAVTYLAYGSTAPDGSTDVAPGGSGPVDGTGMGAALTPDIPTAYGLVTIDTNDLKAITACVHPLPLGAPNAVVGTLNPTNPRGGYASLANYPPTTTPTAAPQLTPVLVPSDCDSLTKPPAEAPSIPLVAGNNGFTIVPSGTTAQVLVASKAFGPGPATLAIVDPATGNYEAQGTFTSQYTDGNIKPPAYSECLKNTFVTGTNSGTSVWVVPFGPNDFAADGGAASLTATSQPIGHSGQGVYYEPFTNTILLPFSQGLNFQLTAFRFNGTAFTQINGTPIWQPPPDLRPNFIGVRAPIPFPCSQGDD
jgi:hypothetical protein